ncbi:MAG TPA: methyltransferase [Terriglobales bacterium]|nr:methyltransferase [Terriglobales bacterium]
MTANEAIAPATAQTHSFNLIRVLSLPWLDRSIAAIGCVPLVYLAYYRYEHWHHGFPLVASAINVLILVVTMIIRRPPKRVTPNPWYWLLAFVATYWQILVLGLLQQGRPLVANWITDSIATLSLVIVIWARLSLGRNIGFVPAQRELVHSGAYAFVRHPVYTGGFLASLAFLLRAYSPQNALLLGLGVFWFIPVKSLVEEDFLCADPEYADYMRRVRARWIPFLV